MRRCGEPYLCDRKNHYDLTDQESYSRLKPGGRKLASATAQARCLPDRYKQAHGKVVSDKGKPPGHGSPERNGAVAQRCRSGVFRPLPITPMLMRLYGVVSVEEMAAASPQAVCLVSVREKRVPGNRFPPCGIDGHKQFAAVRRLRRASLPTGSEENS